MTEENNERLSWRDLLASALREPGILHDAYKRFWSYSSGNQILATIQCRQRGLELGPLASFQRWLDLGRHVMKGQKALALIMPVTIKGRAVHGGDSESGESPESQNEGPRRIFVLKRNWFVLAQTEGEEYRPEPLPSWDEQQALQALQISKAPFQLLEGNTQGYCTPSRAVAINPVAALPHKTLFHEMAHILLGHTDTVAQTDGEAISRSLREVEAESVALICCESLGLPGAEYSRGYIRHWWSDGEVPERSARRAFAVADQILKAGQPAKEPHHGVHNS